MLFSPQNNQQKKEQQASAAATRLQLRERFNQPGILAHLEETIGVPEPGTQDHFWTSARWSMHHLLLYLLKFTGPADLIFSTYTISEDAVRILFDLKKSGQLLSIKCLVDKRFTIRSPKARQLAEGLFDSYTLFDCHAKIMVLDNEQLPLAVIGSANWSENKRYESGVICYSAQVKDFWKHNLVTAIDEGLDKRRN